ncbi:hypothetical protein IWX49DRAFT_325595 [Phyllosticta citricarpa]|uniref:Uncharacterized protein n=1 Tax=Phyllosticta paracitricarpa TaxID=2016321 RepID=A0ABR1MUL0_9PEZI
MASRRSPCCSLFLFVILILSVFLARPVGWDSQGCNFDQVWSQLHLKSIATTTSAQLGFRSRDSVNLHDPLRFAPARTHPFPVIQTCGALTRPALPCPALPCPASAVGLGSS